MSDFDFSAGGYLRPRPDAAASPTEANRAEDKTPAPPSPSEPRPAPEPPRAIPFPPAQGPPASQPPSPEPPPAVPFPPVKGPSSPEPPPVAPFPPAKPPPSSEPPPASPFPPAAGAPPAPAASPPGPVESVPAPDQAPAPVVSAPRGRQGRLIGDVVVEMGFADRNDVESAVLEGSQRGMPTGRVLVERGVLREDQLARVLAERFNLDYVDLSTREVDMTAVALLGVEAIKRYHAVPIGFTADGALLLAMADPTNFLTIDDVAMITGRRVRAVAASSEDVALLEQRLGRADQAIEDIVDEEREERTTDDVEVVAEGGDQDAPVIKLVHSVIAQAVEQNASDIHINPEQGDTRVLYRIDGVLRPVASIKPRMASSVVSRVKIMAELDISEKRVPQDGRFALTVAGRRVDIRVTSLPLVHGEGVVMRILDAGVVIQDLAQLGLQGSEQERLEKAVARPHGAVLVTGPTGSGKTTTLYALLAALNDGERSILTIEDPVESRMPGVRQMQVSLKAGVTFSVGLRSMLRADPDVIMVGEIRDGETARIAAQASLTGHLVLSTLHTRDAPSAIGRLIDMGIEPFLVASSIDCVVAQRLVRLLCIHCRRPTELPDSVKAEYGLARAEPYEAVGCPRCAGTGYRGRTGIYEVMTVTDEMRSLVMQHGSKEEIIRAAQRGGMRGLHQDGLEKVRTGLTSLAEVERMATSLV